MRSSCSRSRVPGARDVVFRIAVTLAGLLAATSGQASGDLVEPPTSASSPQPASPLQPPDTSSPRATLATFLDNMKLAQETIHAAQEVTARAPGLSTPEAARKLARDADANLRRAVGCLDMKDIPPSLRGQVGIEIALHLKEVLDRIELPPSELIPGSGDLESPDQPTLRRWRLPSADITIAIVDEGSREGEFLFTPRSVAQVYRFYQAVQDLPYTEHPSATPGFLDSYLQTPGQLVSPKWHELLPSWSRRVVLTQAIWQWFILALFLAAWALVVVGAHRILIARTHTEPAKSRQWKRALFCLITIVTLLTTHDVLGAYFGITSTILVVLRILLTLAWWAAAAAMMVFLGSAIAETLVASPRVDPRGIQASYYRVLFGLLGFVTGAVVFAIGLERIGVSLLPLLTGVGIGGLAIALAARPTLESIISSFTIFADKPYQLGDRILINGNMGEVESIGVRSTRVRLLSGHVMAVPNEKMAASEIENIQHRPYIRRVFNITITYDTPPDKIERAVAIVKEVLAIPDGADSSHPNSGVQNPELPPRIYFNEFNADSLNIYVSYWYHPPEYWQYMEHAHWINLHIKERFNAEGISFAFPTQTLHLASDEREPVQSSHSLPDPTSR